MKIKRFLTVLGCFVLVLMCAFTVVGCGEVEATADEINAFLQTEGVETTFEDKGYHFDFYTKFGNLEVYKNGFIKMSGEFVPNEDGFDGKIYVEYYFVDANSEAEYSLKTTYYLKDEKYYNTKTKKITTSASDFMTPVLMDRIYEAVENVKDAISDILAYNGQEGATLKLQKKGDIEKGNVEIFATANFETMKNYVYARYQNSKLVDYLTELSGEGTTIKINIKEYNGKINFPNDIENYEDLTTTVMPTPIVAPYPAP